MEKQLQSLKDNGQYREFVTINRVCGNYPTAIVPSIAGEKSVVVWCSNDYLVMSQHPLVTGAMLNAIKNHGAGSGGSRNIGGSHHHYLRLETSIAEWHDKEAALVFPTGYSSNDATLQCLLRFFPEGIVFSDALNHASIIHGIRNSGIDKAIFRHNDLQHLETLLQAQPLSRAKIIIFESVYSMDGDIAPIEGIIKLAKKYNALTFLDEVHAIGMYGPRGAGMAALQGVSQQIDIIQGTMAKAIGVIGGYIAANAVIIDIIRSFASGFIFTTSLPPAVVAACYASIEYLKQSQYERNLLRDKSRFIRKLFKQANIPVLPVSQTHILPVLIGNAKKCKLAAKRLLEHHDIYLQAINSPTVPVGSERFRINVTPNHTDEQIYALVSALTEVFAYLDIPLLHPHHANSFQKTIQKAAS